MIPETLTVAERQILVNQFKILSIIGDNNNYETKIEILENGYTEQYFEVFDVATEEIPMAICEETSQILQMFRRINDAVHLLSEEEKGLLDLEKLKFEGFDANNDPHYHYMTFLVDRMNLWKEYKGMYLNSHSSFPMSKYRKMLEYQYYLLDNDQYDLNKEDLKCMIELLSSSKKIVTMNA
ncbi:MULTISPECIES: YfbU family protein [Flavobacterium]|uniref:YfbU family protein n=1 Tax=Flavobacterium TaxID=237 RepID=UPI001FCA6961|nr:MULTISPECIES: YfbU family protein [Flavobacterium]UOK41166.1 YfbU family protein [Flavobacterium enshiense]